MKKREAVVIGNSLSVLRYLTGPRVRGSHLGEEITIKRKRRLSKDQWTAIAFLMPSIVLILIFVYGFIGWTGYVSVSNWNSMIQDMSFAGLKNYIYLFQDFRFQADLRNTVFFTILFIGFVVVLGLGIAIMIDKNLKGESIFRNIFLF